MKGLRTKKMYEKYKRYREVVFGPGRCSLCDKARAETLKNFRYWKIVKNLFPWDRIVKVHHILIPKRHATQDKLTASEKRELEKLKVGYVNTNYGVLAEATHRKRSIPDHYHLHLIVLK